MAVSHIASAIGSWASSAASGSVTIPSTATASRLIIIAVEQPNSITQTFTFPAGYTSFVSGTGGSTSVGKVELAYKLSAGAADQGSKTVSSTFTTPSTTRISYHILDGVDQTTPIPTAAGNTSTAGGTMSTTAFPMSAVTTTTANAWLCAYSASTQISNVTFQASMTEWLDNAAGSSTIAFATEAIAAAGSTGTRTVTGGASAASWVTVGFSVNPTAAAATTLTQSTFRGRNDDGSETTATWKATAGTDWTQAVDTNFRVRFNISDSVAAATQNTAFVLRYSLNGGAYTAVSGASSVVRATASPNITDGVATTEQLAGAGTFNAGSIDEVDGSALGFTAATATGQDTEVEYVVQIRSVDVVDGDTINLRVYNGTTALDAYTDTPIITVSEPAPPAVQQSLVSNFQSIQYH